MRDSVTMTKNVKNAVIEERYTNLSDMLILFFNQENPNHLVTTFQSISQCFQWNPSCTMCFEKR